MKEKLLNGFYYCAGLFFLLLTKIKDAVSRYTPKPYSIDKIQKCVEYDIAIVDNWLNCLSEYKKEDINSLINNKVALELGPGSDLGVGLYLLSKSIKKYYAIDVYDLASQNAPEFYKAFFEYLKNKGIDTEPLIQELAQTKKGEAERLNFICQKDFNIVSALKEEKIDLLFSNAAFEHFGNIHETIKSFTAVSAENAILITSVDLKTHSRWIREKDPNNIYRYPAWLYKLLSTKSSPNRIRPYQYEEYLREQGWENIIVQAREELKNDGNNTQKYLSKEFRNPKNQMNYLTIYIYATRGV